MTKDEFNFEVRLRRIEQTLDRMFHDPHTPITELGAAAYDHWTATRPSAPRSDYVLAEPANPFSVLATGSVEDMQRFVAELSSGAEPPSVLRPSSSKLLRGLTFFRPGR